MRPQSKEVRSQDDKIALLTSISDRLSAELGPLFWMHLDPFAYLADIRFERKSWGTNVILIYRRANAKDK